MKNILKIKNNRKLSKRHQPRGIPSETQYL